MFFLNIIVFQWIVYVVCVFVFVIQFIVGNGKDGNVGFVVFFVGLDVVFIVYYYVGMQGEYVIGVILLFVFSFKCVVVSGD